MFIWDFHATVRCSLFFDLLGVPRIRMIVYLGSILGPLLYLWRAHLAEPESESFWEVPHGEVLEMKKMHVESF